MRQTIRDRLTALKQAEKWGSGPQQLTYVELLSKMLGGPPEPTQLAFINDPADAKAYMGRAGVAKTSTLSAAILVRAMLQPGFRGLVIRHDYNDLKGTTKERMEEMIQRMPVGWRIDVNKEPPEKWWIRCATDDSISQLTFMGLKERIASYEYNAIAIDEADECDEMLVSDAKSRLRAPGGNYSIMLAFNPPDKTHWLYSACTGLDSQDRPNGEQWLKLFVPREGENRANLPADYYERISKGMPEDLKLRIIKGEWGVVFPGQPVYREFMPKLHVCAPQYDELDRTLIRDWDFGYRRPVCIMRQIDDRGRFKYLREVIGENEEAVSFIDRVKGETRKWFPKARSFLDFGDPAAKQKKDTGSTLEILDKAGINLMFVHSNIEEGVRRCRLALERLVHGEPAMQFSEQGCPLLVRALRGGYHLDKSGRRPVKDNVYDNVADAFRYGVVNTMDNEGVLAALPEPTDFHNATSHFGGGSALIPDSVEYSRDDDINYPVGF